MGILTGNISLDDSASILVVGGGPSGAFFSIRLLREARRRGRKIAVRIIEKKKALEFYHSVYSSSCREGCNYCAGGISPRMMDALEREGLSIPPEILQGAVSSLTVQGGWKNLEMKIPDKRKMLLVYRGTKPKQRSGKHLNFDSFLMDCAIREGAEITTGEVCDTGYSGRSRPWVEYRPGRGRNVRPLRAEADFVVFAAGVNPVPGVSLEDEVLFKSVRRSFPDYRPPQVRKTLIFELEVAPGFIDGMSGEVYFADFGSRDLKIDMFSMIPKENYITVVLIGPVIDRSRPAENREIIDRFLNLPHIRKILPRSANASPVCACNPNMTVGVARMPFAHRVAMIGDMVVSRLYKDGIFSSYLTASTLANCVLDKGVDRKSLHKNYWPMIRRIHRDNRYGRHLFRLNQVFFSHPILSRILYQSILTERKIKPKGRRRLAEIVWKVVSGDDTYRNIWTARIHPSVLLGLLGGGVFITLRNYLTELLFGLKWRGFGRYPTGVYRESLERKRNELIGTLGMEQLKTRQDFERMYSIKIKSHRNPILLQLGRFGDDDKEYFRPNLIKVTRISGNPNEIGSVIRYTLPVKRLSFTLVLDRIVGQRFIVYRVRDGFAQGGVLVFDLEEIRRDVFLLTIYVAFNFPRGAHLFDFLYWRVFGWLFPSFTHDVLWNHSLCKLKDVIEDTDASISNAEGRVAGGV